MKLTNEQANLTIDQLMESYKSGIKRELVRFESALLHDESTLDPSKSYDAIMKIRIEMVKLSNDASVALSRIIPKPPQQIIFIVYYRFGDLDACPMSAWNMEEHAITSMKAKDDYDSNHYSIMPMEVN